MNATALKLGSRSTGTGPTSILLYSSANAYATPVGSVTATSNSAWALLDFGSLNITSPIDAALTFRIYGAEGSGTVGSGNWRIDDISLSATAIPEPSAGALGVGFATLATVAVRRVCRRNEASATHHAPGA